MRIDLALDLMTIMDRVTFGIAVISFVLSVYNFVEGLVKNSKRISISVKYLYKADGYAIMLVEFTNKSQLGISITSGKLVSNLKEEIEFGETSCELFRYSQPELKGKANEKTVTFPINIDPLRAERVLLRTERDLPGFSRNYKAKFGSSRGKISKSLDLPDGHEDLVSLLEHLK